MATTTIITWHIYYDTFWTAAKLENKNSFSWYWSTVSWPYWEGLKFKCYLWTRSVEWISCVLQALFSACEISVNEVINEVELPLQKGPLWEQNCWQRGVKTSNHTNGFWIYRKRAVAATHLWGIFDSYHAQPFCEMVFQATTYFIDKEGQQEGHKRSFCPSKPALYAIPHKNLFNPVILLTSHGKKNILAQCDIIFFSLFL